MWLSEITRKGYLGNGVEHAERKWQRPKLQTEEQILKVLEEWVLF
jgi:hypothetical protein